MASNVKLIDNTIQVENALESAIESYLHEAGGAMVSATQRNIGTLKGRWFSDQREKWTYEVDMSENKCTIGSPEERAIWTELGTGEYALNGDGRKGGWVYFDEKKNEYRKTFGQAPKRPFHTAFTSKKAAIIKQARDTVGSKMK